ncbi:hypothetical protein HanLR1_Chr10g0349551 [Helianthus annuus]|nr:hypothetical protein HanHA89_Chr10g0371321 [Helianthus annuus]KAJ0695794.1 hypothetical protein HanLR1_Chr10g0349551 [Helianthus annuus]
MKEEMDELSSEIWNQFVKLAIDKAKGHLLRGSYLHDIYHSFNLDTTPYIKHIILRLSSSSFNLLSYIYCHLFFFCMSNYSCSKLYITFENFEVSDLAISLANICINFFV